MTVTEGTPARGPGRLLALAMAYGLTQREFRDFGTGDGTGDKEKLSADKGLSQAGA